MKSIKIVTFIFALILMGQLEAMGGQWKLDPAHTGFFFEIKHIYSTVRGQFNDFSGSVVFDPQDLANSTIDLKVKTASINTHNGKRDVHLQSADFFEAERYPLMRFVSSEISHAGDNRYLAKGTMSIKDVSQEMTIEFLYGAAKVHPLKKKELVAGLDANLVLDRLAFHVGDGKFHRMGVVGKDVDVFISLEMMRKK